MVILYVLDMYLWSCIIEIIMCRAVTFFAAYLYAFIVILCGKTRKLSLKIRKIDR